GNILTQKHTGISFYQASQVFRTGIKPVYKITTDAGYELMATAEHKIMTPDGWVELKDLKPGLNKVLIQSGAGKFSSDGKFYFSVQNEYRGKNGKRYSFNLPKTWSKELGQVLGWLIGDGWLRDQEKHCCAGFTFSQEDKGIMDYLKPIINNFYGFNVKETLRENNIYHLMYASKYFVEFLKNLGVKVVKSEEKEVPFTIFSATEDAVIGFLQGIFSADGTIGYLEDKNSYVRLTSKSLKLLKGTQLLLLNLGIKSKIYDRSRNERQGFEYITKNKEKRIYKLDGKLFELHISKNAVPLFLEKVGFLGNKQNSKIEKLLSKDYYHVLFEEEIKSIEFCGEKEVYDLTENQTHSFIANGIVISNCGEQVLLPYESCNLGSLNLYKFAKKTNGKFEVDWEALRKAIHLAVRFLDNVIDINKFPLEEIEKRTKLTRKIGLGVMGWATLLCRLGIPYNSDEALALAEKIMSFILKEARKKSIELAKIKGTFPSFKGSIYDKKDGLKLRNATLTTIAPTGTISIIAGPCSSGIEPLFAVSYYRMVMDQNKLIEVDPVFEEVAKERAFYSRELMEKIAEHGSVQDLKEIPEDVRRVFVTAHDIAPLWHVKMQAVFQKYTDNAVSKTVNFAHEATIRDVYEVYLLSYELGCKGITIYRDGSREEQVLNIAKKEEKKKLIESNNVEKVVVPRHRPEVVQGTTTKVATGCGNLYVTINFDGNGNPFEVFTQMGKAGGCAASQLEAIGRLSSLAFRSGVEVKSIIEQLRNIRCPSPSWEKGQRIFSCADAIARVIERRLVNNVAELEQHSESKKVAMKHSSNDETVVINPGNHAEIVGVCPDCGGALRHEEGCMKCHACGYSKC
ncbi:MAG: LAGLIDADG family homing endonuclease, partial [Candidatus Omnitrophota bacterium]